MLFRSAGANALSMAPVVVGDNPKFLLQLGQNFFPHAGIGGQRVGQNQGCRLGVAGNAVGNAGAVGAIKVVCMAHGFPIEDG